MTPAHFAPASSSCLVGSGYRGLPRATLRLLLPRLPAASPCVLLPLLPGQRNPA
jgi:hypothetical protein